ncbi:MAG: signal peptide peptidase SppA [Phycisphaeraceae bacterium]
MRQLLVILSLITLTLTACGPTTLVVGITPGDQTLTETIVVDEPARRTKIAMIDVTGVIVNACNNSLLQQGENPVAALHEKLERARNDDQVAAVLLRINSPGGSVTASEAMHHEIRRFKASSGKPIVVIMMDVAASGGYYIACAADRIVAYPSTVTGSIGVIMQTVSLKPALDRWGIEATTLRSGAIKGAGSPIDVLTDDQKAIFQQMIDTYHQQFVSIVDAGRTSLDRATIEKLADGRVYTGRQAADLGLIDAVGDLYHAFDLAKRMAQLEQADLVLYHRPLDYVAGPYASTQTPQTPAQTTINLLSLDLGGSNGIDATGAPVIFGYLWTVDGLN